MKKWLCVLFIYVSSFGWTQKNTRILFILDASNSMNVDWNNNQTRMEAAKEVLIQEVEKLRGSTLWAQCISIAQRPMPPRK